MVIKIVAISFTVFKEKILNGTKDQTIRKWSDKRVNQMTKHRKLQLYWKQRTKECELLGEVELVSITKLLMCFEKKKFQILHLPGKTDPIGNWIEYDQKTKQEIIKRDGFKSEEDFVEWFKRYTHDEEYSMIRWKTPIKRKKNGSLFDYMPMQGELVKKNG